MYITFGKVSFVHASGKALSPIIDCMTSYTGRKVSLLEPIWGWEPVLDAGHVIATIMTVR